MVSAQTHLQVRKALTSGEAILVTGAGFSRAARDAAGDPLPLGSELAKQLWLIAFGEEDYDSDSSLGEIYRLAGRKAGGLLRDHLEAVFTVDAATLPPRFVDWFSLPWNRIYTLNIDDLDEKVSSKSSSVNLEILSASKSTPASSNHRGTSVVHLNGRLKDFPDLTFDAPTYGSRTAQNDPWYEQFITDIVSRPTIFVGTVLDETPMWHYLSQRGSKGSTTEQRPKSFLVAPSLSASRRELLAEYNIDLIESTEKSFFDEFVQPNLAEAAAMAESKSHQSNGDTSYLVSVATIVASSPTGDAEFLHGREPSWGDVLSGFAAEFDFDADFLRQARSMSNGALVLHGVAASGKTTTLMRAATVLAAGSDNAVWLGKTQKSLPEVRQDLAAAPPDFIFIDDLDRYGDAGIAFLKGILVDNPTTVVIGAIRTPRMNQLEYMSRFTNVTFMSPPDLSDHDAALLVQALKEGKRLGKLLGLPPDQQVRSITGRANRQLLVSLIEATSGQKLHDKVGTECAELQGLEKAAYGVLCASNAADNEYLSKEDLLIAINSANNAGMAAIGGLVRGHLIVQDGGRLKPRHRVIAESAVDYFRSQGQLRGWIEKLVTLLAIRTGTTTGRSNRYRRLLTRFLGHDFLKKMLGATPEAQLLYGSVETVLAEDFHYWLQRGSLEVESGSLELARTFLTQAQALAPNDRLVETEVSYMLLKQALEAPDAIQSGKTADEGLRRLEALMLNPTFVRPHMYHIYVTHGLRWLVTGNLTPREKLDLRERLRTFADKGTNLFPTNTMIVEAKAKMNRTLMTYFIPNP